MKPVLMFCCLLSALLLISACQSTTESSTAAPEPSEQTTAKPVNLAFDPETFVKPSRAELRERLTALQFKVTQDDGTERPFSNAYWDHKEAGIYVDIVSREPLFSSTHKFKSGTGWPSFYQPLEPKHVKDVRDDSHGMLRVEVRSSYADSHLGHVFQDGPAPTGLRYCINSAALDFVPKDQLEENGLAAYSYLFE